MTSSGDAPISDSSSIDAPHNNDHPASSMKHFDVFCPACEYNLRGLLDQHGATCPECGIVTSLNVLHAKLNSPPYLRWKYLIWTLSPAVVFALILLIDAALPGVPKRSEFTINLLQASYIGILICGPIAIFALSWRSLAEHKLKYRLPMILTLGVILIFMNLILIVVVLGVSIISFSSH